MSDWTRLAISPDATLASAIVVIDREPGLPALVVEGGKILGTICDIELRKAMLRGLPASTSVEQVMRRYPDIHDDGVSIDADAEGNIRTVSIKPNAAPGRSNVAVLMAGGPGERLRPLTQDCPKPLLKVRGKPLLQTTLENLIQAGFRKVYLAVNYKAEMVKDYFGDGKSLGIEISYLHEKTRLGTAGALGLLSEHPSEPLLVMNGDVVTKLNFEQLIDFHTETAAVATMSVRKYEYQIPYGVVKMNDTEIDSLQEKPVQTFFVNAGIYVLNPAVLSLIPQDQYLDMPTLFEKVIASGKCTSAFPIREEWIDIGDLSEYERAQSETQVEFVATINSAAPVLF